MIILTYGFGITGEIITTSERNLLFKKDYYLYIVRPSKQDNRRKHTMIDQTALVHDLISLSPRLSVYSPSGVTLDHYNEHSILDYQWLHIEKLTGTEEIVCQWGNQKWTGHRLEH